MDRKTILMMAKSGAMDAAYTHSGVEIVKAEDGAKGVPNVVPVFASTDAVDRYGDVINQAGWELGDFKANPVIPYAHDYSGNIVARGANIETMVRTPSGSMGLKMDLVFDMNLEQGATIARQFRDGFLRGVSVGFKPLSMTPRASLPDDHPAKGDTGFYIERASLLELSIAPVPVNQEALALRAMATKNAAGGDTIAIKMLEAIRGDVALRAEILKMIDLHADSLPSTEQQEGPELTAKQIEENKLWAALANLGTQE